MFGFPASTEFGRRIPKQKFYENTKISPDVKRMFVEQIKFIYWCNKLATTTLNLEPGNNVREIEIIEIKLNKSQIDESVLRQIDKAIPYHILFILTFDDKVQAWIGYKDKTPSTNNTCNVKQYYHTDWLNEKDLQFQVVGLNLDLVYENLFRQIAGAAFAYINANSLQESIAKFDIKQKLKKQITLLENKIRKEKQLNRRIEMNEELKKIKKEFSQIS